MGDRTTAIIVVMLLLSTLPAIAGEAGASVSPLEAWLVIDASALDNCSAELTALAEATVRALRPGDRLRIVSAQPDEPRLHALESLAEDGGGWAVRPIFTDIHRPSFHRADLGAALGLPLAAARTGQAGHPRVVIVATDGRLNEERSAMLLLRVAELEANGVVVRCTGTEKTNKTLLVAAAQGQLSWTALDKCDPSVWLESVRRLARSSAIVASPPTSAERSTAASRPAPLAVSAPEPAKPAKTQDAPTPPSRAAPPVVTPPTGPREDSAGVSSYIYECRAKPPQESAASSAPRLVPQTTPAPSESQPAEPATAPKPQTPSMPSATTPVTAPTPSAAPTSAFNKARTKPAEHPSTPPPRLTGTVEKPFVQPKSAVPNKKDAPVTLASKVSTPSSITSVPSSKPPSQKTETTQAVAPVEQPQSRQAVVDKAQEAKATQSASPSSLAPKETPRALQLTAPRPTTGEAVRTKLNHDQQLMLILVSALLVAVGVGLEMLRRYLSRSLKSRPGHNLPPDLRELVARVGGHDLSLGPLTEALDFDIGTSPRAAIPVVGDGLLPRHVLLRQRAGVFQVRNRSWQPLIVNGVTLKPRRSIRCVLPFAVVLTDAVKVELAAREVANAEQGGTAHGKSGRPA